QFLFDDVDVLRDRFKRVVREADDVARISDHMRRFPSQQHLAVLGDPVLTLLGGHKIRGIYVLKADEHPPDACTSTLLYEVRNAVAQRVDLDDQPELQFLRLAQFNEPVEDGLPFSVASEIVVGDEETTQALSKVRTHNIFNVFRG